MTLLICAVITALFLTCLAKSIIVVCEKRITHKSGIGDGSNFNFSHIDYLSRIETLCETLWQEPHEKYVLILWWGLDGLRLNENGTREWVNKAKPKPEPKEDMANSIRNTYKRLSYYSMLQNCCCETASRIRALETQNTCLKLQAAQMEQNRAIIDRLNSHLVYMPMEAITIANEMQKSHHL